MSATPFRTRHDDESVGEYNAARDAHNLRQLFVRVEQLESDNKSLATANAALLGVLIEMWSRHAEMARARGNDYEASQWESYAGRLAQQMLDH